MASRLFSLLIRNRTIYAGGRKLSTETLPAPISVVPVDLKRIEEIDEVDPEELSDPSEPRRSLLEPTDEDVSHFVGSSRPSFNFAKYVSRSETLQNLVRLGVDLSEIEQNPRRARPLLRLDFEKDIKSRLVFLGDYVPADRLGRYITKNPAILTANVEDMEVRVNYLRSKRFDAAMIQRIVSENPFWLMFPTPRIDRRLGHFQNEFKLSGAETRRLAVAAPRLITQKMYHIKMNTFAVREELGFEPRQAKTLLMKAPKLWSINQLSLIKRFNYLHLTMEVSHEDLCKTPEVLLTRAIRLRQRHGFLKKIGRDQFDPARPKYVSLMRMVIGSDAEFCREVAECAVSDYNVYLKTL